jgi:hypothetical protein
LDQVSAWILLQRFQGRIEGGENSDEPGELVVEKKTKDEIKRRQKRRGNADEQTSIPFTNHWTRRDLADDFSGIGLCSQTYPFSLKGHYFF